MNTDKMEAKLECDVAFKITPDGNYLVTVGADKVSLISVSSHEIIEEHYCYRSSST